MVFSAKDNSRNAFMLSGKFAKRGYDWWWHSFTGKHQVTGEEKSFFVEFFACNPKRGGAQPVLGQQTSKKKKRPSYLMVKAGCWGRDARQMHRFFGWDDVVVTQGAPFAVEAGDCFVCDTVLRGRVSVSAEQACLPEYMCQSGTMSFDLTIDKVVPFNVGYGASKLFRDLKAFEMYWHAEGMKSRYSGTVTLDGQNYIVDSDTSYGYADKNWGRGFTSPWVWLSSCDLVSDMTGKRLNNSVFNIGGGKPKVFGISLPRQLLSAFYLEGKEYEFNFSKFWTSPKTQFSCDTSGDSVLWHVKQQTRHNMIEVDVRCQKRDMLLVNYEDPMGTKQHNQLFNGGNGVGKISIYSRQGKHIELIERVIAKHIGCEYGEFD